MIIRLYGMIGFLLFSVLKKSLYSSKISAYRPTLFHSEVIKLLNHSADFLYNRPFSVSIKAKSQSENKNSPAVKS